MAVKKIVVPIRGDGKGEGVLSHAAAIARRHSAHVEAVHCRARPTDMIPYGVVVPHVLREQIRKQAEALANEEEASLRQKFIELLARLGLEMVECGVPAYDRPTASWCEEAGKMMDVIRVHGRLADIVAVAKPDRDRNLGVNTLKAAIFQTGRPVLVCPPGPAPDVLGARIAIAWNGSMQATRSVGLAMPLLREAEEVTILDGGAEHEAMGGEAFRRYLEVHGVPARIRRIDARDNPGLVLLAESAKAGADLLVMGAYSHSREHEVIFGGATQHVVDNLQTPVLMTH